MAFYKNAVLENYVNKDATRLSLKVLLNFGKHMSEGKLLRSANYVREEMPVRLAHRINAFQQLPFVVGSNKSINQVYELYWEAFEAFRKVTEITTLEQNKKYCELLMEKMRQHQVVIPLLSRGFQECIGEMPDEKIEDFLTRTLRSRLSRRLIIQQHLRLSDSQPHEEGYIGVLASKLEAAKLIGSAADICTTVCKSTYGVAPHVHLQGDVDAVLAGVPEHIELVLHDLLKNSMRAVVERSGYVEIADDVAEGTEPIDVAADKDGREVLPPVVVTIAESEKDVLFRISDQGGGIPFDDLDKVWNFTYTTARHHDFNVTSSTTPSALVALAQNPEEPLTSAPMAGTGFGLLTARVHAEYLGGSIQLKSMEGYGTDAYYRAKRTADDQLESIV